ncbi:MAG: HAD family hydrolase [Bacteroidota bacterium]
MIDLIVFDMAGTTVQDNHEVEFCFAEAALSTGLKVSSERILSLQGYSKIEVFKMLWKEASPNLSKINLTKKVNKSYLVFCQILENHYQNNDIYPTEGCLQLFDYLRKNEIKIALTTGFYRKVTDIILQKLDWLEGLNEQRVGTVGSIIDVSVASDEVQYGRPKPDMILKAKRLLDVTDSQKVIAIGDTPSDLIAGNAANCFKTFGVTNGTHSEQQLIEYQSDGLFPSLISFQNFLEKYNQI